MEYAPVQYGLCKSKLQPYMCKDFSLPANYAPVIFGSVNHANITHHVMPDRICRVQNDSSSISGERGATQTMTDHANKRLANVRKFEKSNVLMFVNSNVRKFENIFIFANTESCCYGVFTSQMFLSECSKKGQKFL